MSGDEVLEMMSGKTPRKVRDLHGAGLREGRERILKETGEDFTSVFTDAYPVKPDHDPIDRKRNVLAGRHKRNAFRGHIDSARTL